jgi:hypothetical protein
MATANGRTAEATREAAPADMSRTVADKISWPGARGASLGLFLAELSIYGGIESSESARSTAGFVSWWEQAMDDENAQFLAEANEHIENAEVRIAGVHAHIAELELGGRDTSTALSLLEELENALALMRRHRDEIVRLLGDA